MILVGRIISYPYSLHEGCSETVGKASVLVAACCVKVSQRAGMAGENATRIPSKHRGTESVH